uniref:Response regulatory domain-containing protein n=1 Tax=Brassica oleracea var. oleracea TaxID=109376 RepID=A0A0D3CMV1_BRAOL
MIDRAVHCTWDSSKCVEHFLNYMAENGEEAVNLYRDGQTFNLILMDNEMPATKELRDLGVTSMIVGLTSHEDENSVFMEAGADHCLAKPITFENIYLLIEQLKDEG